MQTKVNVDTCGCNPCDLRIVGFHRVLRSTHHKYIKYTAIFLRSKKHHRILYMYKLVPIDSCQALQQLKSIHITACWLLCVAWLLVLASPCLSFAHKPCRIIEHDSTACTEGVHVSFGVVHRPIMVATVSVQ